jgi:hypothetical protein
MDSFLIGAAAGCAAAIVIVVLLRRKGKATGPRGEVHVHPSIEQLRSVGELVVFKMITKEIVTAADHVAAQRKENGDDIRVRD